MFSDFASFGDFDRFFDTVFNRFNRPVQDMKPFNAYQTDNGYIIVANALGIKKENISVRIENRQGSPYPILHIKGETKIEKINFHNSIDLALSLKLPAAIDEVQYQVADGLCTIFIKTKVEKENVIDGHCLGDDEELGW